MNPEQCLLGRRRLLARMVAVSTSILFTTGCNFEFRPGLETYSQHFVNLLRYPELALVLGKRYYQEDSSIQQMAVPELTRSVLQQLNLDFEHSNFLSLLGLDDKVSKRVHQDFIDENTISVGGWFLSITEARICALLYQSSKN